MSAEGLVSSILGLLEQAPKVFFALALVGIVIIFSPDSFVERLGLTEFRLQYKSYIGIATLTSTALLLAHLGSYGYSWIRQRFVFWRTMRDLTLEEKRVLKKYILNDEPTQSFAIGDGVANGLAHKKILYRASNVGTDGQYFDFNLQTWARRYLKRRKNYFRNVPDLED